jgi:hypothetical protein
MQQVYLTRRNLLTLLNKLDRTAKGDPSACTIVKFDRVHPKYPCTDVISVTAVEDADYYIDREPGRMLEKDEPKPPSELDIAVDCAEASLGL